MKSRIFSGVAAATLAIALLGCSSARVESPAPTTPLSVANLPSVNSLVQEPTPSHGFKACTLGQSCMNMDERPFELCLVSGKRCADKIKEPLLVDRPKGDAPPPDPRTTVAHPMVSPE